MLAEARERRLAATADVSAHQLFLTEDDLEGFDSNCHVDPPLRTAADRAALREAVAAGLIDAVCSDHQPHEEDAKLAPFPVTEPGVSSLETLLPLVLRLADEGVMDLSTAIARLTREPARILGLAAGNLAPGAVADVCIFDPAARWTVSADNLASHGHNTPFLGQEMKGRVSWTLLAGRVVFERG
jgi:dihydroorotase